MRNWCSTLLLGCILAGLGISRATPPIAARPKVRTITAFVRVTPANFQQEVQNAVSMLRQAQRAYEQQGYEVETIRITTQPFAEIVNDVRNEQAVGFYRDLNRIAERESFIVSLGPAMLADTDAAAKADLLARVLAENDRLNGSVIVAQQDGVHWNAVRAAAKAVKYLSEHSAGSEATFHFAAVGMLSEYGPFFPGSYHTGAGRSFSVGLESANVIQAVLIANQGNLERAGKALVAELGRYNLECEQVAHQI